MRQVILRNFKIIEDIQDSVYPFISIFVLLIYTSKHYSHDVSMLLCNIRVNAAVTIWAILIIYCNCHLSKLKAIISNCDHLLHTDWTLSIFSFLQLFICSRTCLPVPHMTLTQMHLLWVLTMKRVHSKMISHSQEANLEVWVASIPGRIIWMNWESSRLVPKITLLWLTN